MKACTRLAQSAAGLLSFFLGLAAFMAPSSLFAQADPSALAYTITLEPERPLVGEYLDLGISLVGLSSARIARADTDDGLSLEYASSRPLIDSDGNRGSVVSIRFLVKDAGARTIGPIVIEGLEGRREIAAFTVETLPLEGWSPGIPSYRWSFPEGVFAYSCFPIRILGADGTSPPPGLALAWAAPPGLIVEESGEYAWIGTALSPGTLSLPGLELLDAHGKPAGRVAAAGPEILAIPDAVSASRAFGDFSLGFEGPSEVLLGDRLLVRLVLRGRGNHPSLRLPRISATLDGKPLAEEALALRRRESIRPGDGVYEGSSSLEIGLAPDLAGRLRIHSESFAFLGADGRIHILVPRDHECDVRGLGAREEGRRRMPALGAAAEQALEGLDLPAGLAELRRRGDYAALALELEVGEEARDGGGGKLHAVELAVLRAEAHWELGDGPRALATLLAAVRRGAAASRLMPLVRSLSGELGVATPPVGTAWARALLGPLAWALAAAGILGIADFLIRRRRRRNPGPGGISARARGYGPLVIGFLSAALGLGLYAAGLALETGGEEAYAVLAKGRFSLVPSERGEAGLPYLPGSGGRVVGRGAGYVGIALPEGSVGWAPLDSVYFY